MMPLFDHRNFPFRINGEFFVSRTPNDVSLDEDVDYYPVSTLRNNYYLIFKVTNINVMVIHSSKYDIFRF